MSRLVNWALAGAAVAIFFAAQALATHNDDLVVADDAAAAVTAAQVLARRDEIAQILCDSELGPSTQVLWTREGDLVCRPAVQAIAKGGAL